MRDLTYYVGVTVDGYIAGPEHEVDFFPVSDDHVAHMSTEFPEVLPTHVRRHLGHDDAPNRRFDTVVMGRATYEQGVAQGVTEPYQHLHTVVATSSRHFTSPESVEVTDDPVDLVRQRKRDDGDLGIWLAGGGQLAGALLPEIDRIITKVYPVVAGTGYPIVAGAFDPVRWKVAARRGFSSGCSEVTYVRSAD